ncbi:MAG: ABC transporter substrate-binding protein, partial [Gemmatimonadetes bacterium]|nr:ABC transporter substrate-binding protein [Gemmatimonadota bacterium]
SDDAPADDAPADDAPSEDEGGEAESPPAGNRVVIALTQQPVESTRYWTSPGVSTIVTPMLQPLVGIDPVTGAFDTSALAESWTHNDDLTEWTFKLREGIQFHKGYGELTAEDVIHSYELHTADDSTLTDVNQLRGAEVTALDRYTVRFQYDRSQFIFPSYVSYKGALFIYSKAQFDAEGLDGYDTNPAGTGAYEFVEASPGRMLFQRVENHWSGHTADFEEMEFRFVPETSTRFAMLEAGEADLAILNAELNQDAEQRGFSLLQSSIAGEQSVIHFNGLYGTTGDPAWRPDLPWADVRIREALNRAINREELMGVLFNENAELNPVVIMHPTREGYHPELEERFEAEYGYDPERSRQLMQEANYPDAFEDPTIRIALFVGPALPQDITLQMELIQSYWNAVGFEVEIVEMDIAAAAELGRAREAYYLNPARNIGLRPTDVMVGAWYTVAGGPLAGYESDRIEELIAEYRQELVPEQREASAREVFEYAFEQYIELPMFEIFTQVAANPDTVGGWTYSGSAGSVVSHWELIEAAQ